MMVTSSKDAPTRNSERCSSSALGTRSSLTNVPLVDFKSISLTISCRTSTLQCLREISGSSISMSAPPPNRPMIIRGLVIGCLIPLAGPPIPEMVMFLSLGSSRPEYSLTCVLSGSYFGVAALGAGVVPAAVTVSVFEGGALRSTMVVSPHFEQRNFPLLGAPGFGGPSVNLVPQWLQVTTIVP